LPEKKCSSLLRDPNVHRWYSNMKKVSVISAEINLRALFRMVQSRITEDSRSTMREDTLDNSRG
jgi:hypothetical protein